MTTEAPWETITSARAFELNLHHAGVEERLCADGVHRAFHAASRSCWETPAPNEDPSAQDVIDALRLALMSQHDDKRAASLARALVEMAPETANDRGIRLLLSLVAEGSMKLEMVGNV